MTTLTETDRQMLGAVHHAIHAFGGAEAWIGMAHRAGALKQQALPKFLSAMESEGLINHAVAAPKVERIRYRVEAVTPEGPWQCILHASSLDEAKARVLAAYPGSKIARAEATDYQRRAK